MTIYNICELVRELSYTQGMLTVRTDSESTNRAMDDARRRIANIVDDLEKELPECDTTDVRNAFAMLDLLGYRKGEEEREDG